MGSFNGVGFPEAARPSLDGAPSGSAQIVYPLDGAIFPKNLGPIYVHITNPGSATAARLSFKGESTDVTWYGACEVDAKNLPGNGCYVKLPLDFTQKFIPNSELGDMTLTARVGGSGAPAETAPIKVAWSNVSLTGGLYYWTVMDPAALTGYVSPEAPAKPNGTGFQRYDFAKDNPAPELIWTDRGAPPFTAMVNAPQAWDAGLAGGHCVGCHAITNDGKYMAMTIGGSSSRDGANFAVLDIGAKSLLNINPTARSDMNSSTTSNPTDYWKMFRMEKFGTETAWGPNSDVMVNMYLSVLYLSSATIDSTLGTGVMTQKAPALPSWKEYQGDPFWSQDGKFLAFTSFTQKGPIDTYGNPTGLNGDVKPDGAIAIATAEAATIHDDAKILVPRQAGVSSYYPAISNDSKLLAFNKSTCAGAVDANKVAADYGQGSCDGYDDWSATLWLTSPSGSAPVKMDRANGTMPASNSWPRWSPDNGPFRGKRLYWIAFSSRRPYGLQVNPAGPSTTAASAKPQLWFAGVVTGDEFQGDPSFAPVWLPGQNSDQSKPNGNHVPQWVKVAVPVIQ